MAVNATTYMPFDSGAGANVTESGWRSFMQLMTGRGDMANGVIRSITNTCQVYGDSSGLQVKVKTGQVWIKSHWGEVASELTLPIASNSSGNPRKDLVVARAHFTNNAVQFDVITGTPAGSPTLPTPTQNTTMWEVPLAEVSVANGAATITAANVQDGRRYVDNIDDVSFASANITKNASTTLSNVSGMFHFITGGATYTIDGFFEYSASTTADAKWLIATPPGCTGRITVGVLDATTAAITGSFAAAGNGVGTRLVAPVRGWITVPNVTTDPGGFLSMQVQFAQNTSDATDAVMYQGSWLRLSRYQA